MFCIVSRVRRPLDASTDADGRWNPVARPRRGSQDRPRGSTSTAAAPTPFGAARVHGPHSPQSSASSSRHVHKRIMECLAKCSRQNPYVRRCGRSAGSKPKAPKRPTANETLGRSPEHPAIGTGQANSERAHASANVTSTRNKQTKPTRAGSAGRPQNHAAIRKLALRLAGWL